MMANVFTKEAPPPPTPPNKTTPGSLDWCHHLCVIQTKQLTFYTAVPQAIAEAYTVKRPKAEKRKQGIVLHRESLTLVYSSLALVSIRKISTSLLSPEFMLTGDIPMPVPCCAFSCSC